MQTTTTTNYNVKVIWSGQGFGKAVAYAKSCGGLFDAQTKTWAIPANCAALSVERRHFGEVSSYVDEAAFFAAHGLEIIL